MTGRLDLRHLKHPLLNWRRWHWFRHWLCDHGIHGRSVYMVTQGYPPDEGWSCDWCANPHTPRSWWLRERTTWRVKNWWIDRRAERCL